MSDQQKSLIYCRVSSTKQSSEGSGLKSQEHRCRQYAEQNGYDVEAVFTDDVTGRGDFNNRPGIVALLDHLKGNKKNQYVVIFDDLKRLSRDIAHYPRIKDAIINLGAEIESPNYRFDSSLEGWFSENINVLVGDMESRQIARQNRQKTIARVEAGYHARNAPVGYYMGKDKTHGKLLMPKEPAASAIREALEGFALGRFETAQEVRRFLESNPMYPKNATGKIGNSKAKDLLTNPTYAGFVQDTFLGISLRKGHHQGLISWETFTKIQERLEGRVYAPARKDLNEDFPLRGAVSCECGNTLTSCWSKSRTGAKHPYYLCQNRKCDHKGKSIRRDVLEGEFEALLQNMSPSHPLMSMAEKLFRMAWDAFGSSQKVHKDLLEKEHKSIDSEIKKQLDKIVDTTSPTVMGLLEERVCKLEDQKRVLDEKLANVGQPIKPFDQMYRTAMDFLKNPNKIWQLGNFAERRAVLKLAFSDRLVYDRKTGYRTPDFSLPFKVLGDFFDHKNIMVPGGGIEPPTRGFSILCSTD